MKNYFVGFNVDFLGFVVSLLCIVHCLCLPFLVTVLPLLGASFLENPMVENGLLVASVMITIYALRHHFKGTFYTQLPILIASVGLIVIFSGSFFSTETAEISVKALGVLLVCTAHIFNWRSIHRK